MLKIKNLTKKYNNAHGEILAIENLDLIIEDSDFISIVGPSGCGKSTILRLVSGLTKKNSGSIAIDEKEVIGPNKEKGMVFQNFSLFPWLSVEENILFGLNLKKDFPQVDKTKILDHYLDVTGLKDFRNAYPKNLSGGMQQRVAIARALANTPKVLLMDEPFGALDSQTRSQMQELLTRIWEKEKMTVLFVTHDVAEAAFLSDKIIVLSKRPGRIKKIFNVPFSRSRSHELKKNKSFFEFVNKVGQELEAD
jgi:NitT/TauT family transport system ATP-binding protein